MNMVGTAQTNRTGAPAAADVQKLKVGTYESIFWQHRMLNLCYIVWPDNNKVKTLSNFQIPDVLEVGSGMLRKMRVDGKRDRDKSEVPCPVQMKDYCETFHLIDKGNGAEAHYGMGGRVIHTTGRQSWCSGFGICRCIIIMRTKFTWRCTNNTCPMEIVCR